MMNYCTLICDIKESRKLKNREAVQYQIIDMLNKANTRFKSDIISPFLITIGDEWEGLLKHPCDYRKILSFFRECMPGVRFYSGIGIGVISIHNFKLPVNQLDGPSFHIARQAIKYAKTHDLPVVVLFDDWNNL